MNRRGTYVIVKDDDGHEVFQTATQRWTRFPDEAFTSGNPKFLKWLIERRRCGGRVANLEIRRGYR